LKGKTTTDIIKLLIPDDEPTVASDATIDTTAEPIEPEPEPLKLKPLPYSFVIPFTMLIILFFVNSVELVNDY
jgi:hypothetical protein